VSGKSSAELRADVEAARTRLASTVGEIGSTIDEGRNEVVRRAKQAAPIVGAAIGGYVILKVFRRHR
jgi:hypothetical protein